MRGRCLSMRGIEVRELLWGCLEGVWDWHIYKHL